MKANTGALSEAWLNAPAGIAIVCRPCTVTGVLLKWKVIVALALVKVGAKFDGILFTVTARAWTDDGLPGQVKLTMN